MTPQKKALKFKLTMFLIALIVSACACFYVSPDQAYIASVSNSKPLVDQSITFSVKVYPSIAKGFGYVGIDEPWSLNVKVFAKHNNQILDVCEEDVKGTKRQAADGELDFDCTISFAEFGTYELTTNWPYFIDSNGDSYENDPVVIEVLPILITPELINISGRFFQIGGSADIEFSLKTESGDTVFEEATIKIGVNSCTASFTNGQGECSMQLNTAGEHNVLVVNPNDKKYEFTDYDFGTVLVGDSPDLIINLEEVNPSPVLAGNEIELVIIAESKGQALPGTATIRVDDQECTAVITTQAGGCKLIPRNVGVYDVIISFIPDSSTGTITVTEFDAVEVLKAPSTTTITSVNPPNLSVYGKTAIIYVSVSGDTQLTPTGNVNVLSAAGSCSLTLDENGQGFCSFPMKYVGQFPIKATYEGDAVFDGSEGRTSYGVIEPTPEPPKGNQGSGPTCDTSKDLDCDGVLDDYDACPSKGDLGKGVNAEGCPNP